jgi:group I intron endonuclease
MAKKIFGIYCIENLINNKKYIGKSKNIIERWYNHIYELRSGIHPNNYLQKSFNKYGEKNFKFWIIEEYPIEDLSLFEIYWIAYFNSYRGDGCGYNLSRGGDGNDGYVCSNETKRKISKIKKGIPMPERTRKRISEANIGRIPSNETRKKMSESAKGNTSHKGFKHSEESIRKMQRPRPNRWEKGMGEKKINSSSKYIGVFLKKGRKKKWGARISYQGKGILLGYFYTEIEAAIKYNEFAIKYYEDRAILNKIDSIGE